MHGVSADFFDESDDATLLGRARAGDTRSADILWIRVRPAVVTAARGIAANSHDAEDLASEAMTKVFAAIADGQGPTESILPYLHVTMRNLHVSSLRRAARVGTPLELDEQRVLNLVTTEPDAIESELVTRAFKSLPDRWRYVLWASLVEGRPGQEIADALSIRPAAVHALKSRALEGLRQHYLSEHAQLSEEQECAAVHRVLASIARGRTRRSTDQNQVWRHLRGCEHCAEGYREITAINSQIGALLGPAAAAAVVGIAPHTKGAALLELLRLPAAASQVVVAAGVAGVLAVAGPALVPDRSEPRTEAGTAAAPAAGPSATPTLARSRPVVATPPTADRPAAPRRAATPQPRCVLGLDPSAGLAPVDLGQALEQADLSDVASSALGDCVSAETVPDPQTRVDVALRPAVPLADLVPSTVPELLRAPEAALDALPGVGEDLLRP